MKTITDTDHLSKYFLTDDKTVTVKADCIEIGSPVEFIIGDLHSSNSSVIEGVTTPDDWFGCKYTCAADGTWSLVEGWVDPREEEAA